VLELASWSAGGRSVRGARHERAGEPNQDAIAVAHAPVTVVAVADGHGSKRHPRSDVGAAIAVAVARDLLPAFAADESDVAALRPLLAAELVAAWRAGVQAHLADHPLHPGPAGGDALLAYGATLVAVVATGERVLAVQIGDGDVWLADATAARRLVARDLRFAFNGTASLCMDRAADEVRVARVMVDRPALVLVATDGFARPLATDADFVTVLRSL
jgi:serine/threonine protein phosphatase PrpC